MSKITLSTSSYNERRYGRPYIALCDEQAKVVSWGSWLGTPGNSGELSLDVPDVPCIVMKGQKDNRGNNGSAVYSLAIGGKLDGEDWTADKMSVVRRLREAVAQKSPSPSVEALKEERARLLARIAEIDAELGAA